MRWCGGEECEGAPTVKGDAPREHGEQPPAPPTPTPPLLTPQVGLEHCEDEADQHEPDSLPLPSATAALAPPTGERSDA